MTSLATNAAKRLVSQHAKQFEPEDPFYEYWTDSKGKEKRRKVSLHPTPVFEALVGTNQRTDSN
jgi:hypothetical protein